MKVILGAIAFLFVFIFLWHDTRPTINDPVEPILDVDSRTFLDINGESDVGLDDMYSQYVVFSHNQTNFEIRDMEFDVDTDPYMTSSADDVMNLYLKLDKSD